MNNLEIEAKYLIKDIDLSEYKVKFIEQGYLSINPVVRIRKNDSIYILTYKNKEYDSDNVLISTEKEIIIDEITYNNLKNKCDGNIITKKRYLVPLYDDYIAEVDVFLGVFYGIKLAEVEFKNREHMQNFVKPDWFLENVSSDKRFYNSNMTRFSIDEINKLKVDLIGRCL